jgi:hypothetical protein
MNASEGLSTVVSAQLELFFEQDIFMDGYTEVMVQALLMIVRFRLLKGRDRVARAVNFLSRVLLDDKQEQLKMDS